MLWWICIISLFNLNNIFMWNKIYLFICLPQLLVFSHSFTHLLLILQSLSSTYCLHVDKQEPGTLLCKNNAYSFVYFVAYLPNTFRFPRLSMCLCNMGCVIHFSYNLRKKWKDEWCKWSWWMNIIISQVICLCFRDEL